jgi:CTD small phosphatase-like protein 2
MINQTILNFPTVESQPSQLVVSKDTKGRGKRSISVGKSRLQPIDTRKNDVTMGALQAEQLAKYCKKVLDPISYKAQPRDSSSFSPQDSFQQDQEKSVVEEKSSQDKASIGRRRQKSLQTEKPPAPEEQKASIGRRRQKSLQDKAPINEQQQASDISRIKTESIVNEKIIEVNESQEIAEGITNEEQQNYQLDDCDEADSPNTMSPKRLNHMITPKELVFGPNVKEDILKKHAYDIAQGVKYATKRVKAPPVNQLQHRQITLKRLGDTFKKTLVLDLDETLIYAQMNSSDRLPSIGDKNEARSMKVMIRPYAEEFLKEMSKEFEILIFTAAEKTYAESMINLLDPKQQYVSYILHREHCLRTKKGLLIKDLRILKNRDLKDMVLVDNFTPSFSFQLDNGIPIITWRGDPKDQELKYLMNYLLEAKKYFDMRLYNKEKLRLEDIAKVSPEKFAESG